MKTSKRIPPGTPKYHRLTSENRIIIWTLKKEGRSMTYTTAPAATAAGFRGCKNRSAAVRRALVS